jgi:hypothetical protein
VGLVRARPHRGVERHVERIAVVRLARVAERAIIMPGITAFALIVAKGRERSCSRESRSRTSGAKRSRLAAGHGQASLDR